MRVLPGTIDAVDLLLRWVLAALPLVMTLSGLVGRFALPALGFDASPA